MRMRPISLRETSSHIERRLSQECDRVRHGKEEGEKTYSVDVADVGMLWKSGGNINVEHRCQ